MTNDERRTDPRFASLVEKYAAAPSRFNTPEQLALRELREGNPVEYVTFTVDAEALVERAPGAPEKVYARKGYAGSPSAQKVLTDGGKLEIVHRDVKPSNSIAHEQGSLFA